MSRRLRPVEAGFAAAPRPPKPMFEAVARASAGAVLLDAARPIALLSTAPGWGRSRLLAQCFEQAEADGRPCYWFDRASGGNAAGAEAALAEPAALICVDDAASSEVAEAVNALVARRTWPAGAQILLAATTRPLGIAEAELAGTARILREINVAAGSSEAEAMLGAGAAPSAVAELTRSADGWIAAMRLQAAEHGTSRREALLPALKDFLEDRVYASFDASLQHALMLASVLDEFDGALFADVTGSSRLADLQAMRAFLLPGARPGWLRLQRHYRLFLQSRATGLGRSAIRGAHRRAAELHGGAGRFSLAANHALETGDRTFAVEAIDRGARAFIAEGRISDALSWLDQLAEADRAKHPRIGLFHAAALALAGRWDEAEDARVEIEKLAVDWKPPREREELVNHARFQRELLVFVRGETTPDLAPLESLIAETAQRDRVVHGEATLLMGLILRRRGQPGDARAAIERATKTHETTSSWYALAIGVASLAELDLRCSDGGTAALRCSEALAQLGPGIGEDAPALAVLRLMLADVAWSSGDSGSASEHLEAGAALLDRLQSSEQSARAALMRARLARIGGRLDEAERHAERARDLLGPTGLADLLAAITAELASLQATSGRLAQAARTIGLEGSTSRFTAKTGDIAALARMRLALGQARILLEQGHATEAERRASDLGHHARRLKFGPECIEAAAVQAAALLATDPVRGQRAIRQAGMDATAAGLEGLACFAPGAVGNAFASLRPRPTGALTETVAAGVLGDGWRDAGLTAKEAEVLALIAAGLSNQAIADDLFASITTVKWHVRNILGKLDASNRSAAVAAARRRRLIV